MPSPNERHQRLALSLLQDLVRIDTTNPPGNELACARYLADRLAQAGIQSEIIESAPGRGNLVARLRGNGQAKPLVLMGHLDVVSADASTWTYPPFAAEIHDGFVWGRGTTDMKQMIAVSAAILIALAKSQTPLRRDLVLMATADEEHGGRMGMGWLVKNRPELFDVACAINEGGGTAIRVGERTYYTVQSAEKGLCRTVWTARSQGGHASSPRSDIATLKLSQALCRLGDGHLRPQIIDTMRAAVRRIARDAADGASAQVERYLATGQIEAALHAAGLAEPEVQRTRALFYDTVSATGLRAGDPQSINVIPPTATAYLDGRILPGQTRAGFLQALAERAGDEIEIALYQEQFSPGLESPVDAPIVQTITDVIAEQCDGAAVIPWQCAGSTDAKHLIPAGVPVYGFVPSRPLPEGIVGAGAHANDERLWLENLDFAYQVLYEVTHRFCTQG
jgi:acetylornithine deacetylase/succinyl-diaminopimelate desuccinylase-like protein